MLGYWTLLGLLAPVFALVAAGGAVRRLGWFTPAADESVLRLVVNLLYPCLILDHAMGNQALRDMGNLVYAPILGFVTMAGGILLARAVAVRAGFTEGTGLRTFAFGTGINNYGYFAIPVVEALFGREALGVLFVFNVGVEAAIWTVGILMLSGVSLRDGWRRLLNPPMCALIAAIAINLLGADDPMPEPLRQALRMAAACAVPLGLLVVGATLFDYVGSPRSLFHRITSPLSCALRLGLLPALILVLAAWLPIPAELRGVLIVQAAMPAGIMPIVIARHYGGRPLVAVQIVVATTLLGLFTAPLWLKTGLQLIH